MKRFFNEPRYARQALANCLLRIGKEPVWVCEIDDDYSTTFLNPLTGKSKRIDDLREIEGLNIDPVPLGYVNFDSTAEYVQRIPRRRWKQGLCPESCSIPMSSHHLQGKQVSECIMGIYPDLDTCIKKVTYNYKVSMAFGRRWAVTHGVVDPSLKYKNKVVGIVKDGECKLSPKFSYLQQVLDKVVTCQSKSVA